MRKRGPETGRGAAFGAVLGALVIGAAADAEEPPGDAMMRDYLSERAAKLESAFLPGARDTGAFEKLRPRLREEYLHMLGLWPLPEKGPLRAVVTGK
ncbi:MAG TPA: hypothetical protein VMT52_13935, partial [Planctomycetota bacterium]|nr:hypothetical protein [Planctomycetota bacterium]